MIGLIKRQIYGSLHDSGRWVLGIPFWELTKRTLLETILLYCLQHCSIRLIPSLWAFVPITAQLYLGQGWTNFFYKGQFKKNKIHNIVCIYTCNTTATELKKKKSGNPIAATLSISEIHFTATLSRPNSLSLHCRIWHQYWNFELIWWLSKTFLELVYFAFSTLISYATWILSLCLWILLLVVKCQWLHSNAFTSKEVFIMSTCCEHIILISCLSLPIGRHSSYLKIRSVKQYSPCTLT